MDTACPATASIPVAWRRARIAASVALLLGTLPSVPEGVVFWDNAVKIEVARNLLDGRGPLILRGTPDDGQYLQRGRGGRFYASAPLGSVLLQLPNGVLASRGLVPFEGIPTLLVLAVLAWVLVRWAERAGATPLAGLAGALATCLATALWPSAALGYDNVVEALALAAVLSSTVEPDRRRTWLVVGAIVSAAFTVRQTAALLGVPVLVLAVLRRPSGAANIAKRLALAAVGAAPFLAAAVAYNLFRFGSILSFDAAAARAGSLAEAADFFVRPLSGTHLTAIAALLASPGKGLVFYGPPIVFAAVLARPLARRFSPEAAAFAAYAAALLLFVGLFVSWHGDWSWGPRLVAPLYVCVAPAIWVAWERFGARGLPVRIGAIAVLVAAAVAQGVPVAGAPVPTYFHDRVGPLSNTGILVSRPITRSRLGADTVTLYWTPRNSPILVLASSLPRRLRDQEFGPLLAADLTRTLLGPFGAILALLLVARAGTAQKQESGFSGSG